MMLSHIFFLHCILTHKAMFGDGASLDLAMVEAWHFFQRSSWQYWSLAAAASFSEYRKA
jgi:hypothetical protein